MVMNTIFVKISYARLDIISVQLKFRAVAYAESMIETNSQDLSWETLKGKKTQQSFLCIRCIR